MTDAERARRKRSEFAARGFGPWLGRRLADRRMLASDLARAMGIGEFRVKRWLGEWVVDLDDGDVEKMAVALGLSVRTIETAIAKAAEPRA